MANPYTGEVSLVLNGERRIMKLTLGAIVELELALQADSLVALVERFESGSYSARDVIALLAAGLSGGGWAGDANDVARAEIEGGPLEGARAAAELLARSFVVPAP